MGRIKNPAVLLTVVTTLFAIMTVSDGNNSTSGPSSSSLNGTLGTALSPYVTLEPSTSPPNGTLGSSSSLLNRTLGTSSSPLHRTQETDQFLLMLQQLFKNPQVIGNTLQSVIPALSSILETSLSGSNITSSPSSQLENLLRSWLFGLSNGGNGSSSALTGTFGKLEAQTIAAIGKYLDEPVVKETVLPLMFKIAVLLQDELKRNNNGTFPPISDLPAAFSRVGVSRIFELLHQASVPQTLLQNLPHGEVQDACFSDIVDTLNGLVSFKKWALDMFDATGKIESGLQKGHFYFIGTYDQCYQAKPRVETVHAGGLTSTRTFGTHFCRANINIPDSLTKSLNVDTRGVKLKITWGLCVPESCKSNDVEALFGIVKLSNASLPVESVYCYEDEDLSSDTSAIVAICTLSIIGLIIVSGTLIDACRAYFAEPYVPVKEKLPKTAQPTAEKSSKLSEANGSALYENTRETKETSVSSVKMASVVVTVGGEEPDNLKSELPLPPGYMPHKETGIEIFKTPHHLNYSSAAQQEPTVDKQKQQKKDGILIRLLLCFSLYSNIPKILNAKSSSGSVACIHGIRFFSLTWVVLGHTYNYGVISMEETLNAANLLDFVSILQRFTYQTVVAGGFAVDTFFVLSAFLLTWLHLKDKVKKKKKCTLTDSIYFYFHRFWRLSPIYMFVLMAFACLYKYLGSGPMWPSSITTAENCKDYWWTNLLYVNNLVHLDNQCMGWTWYLANDMQFYVVSPIFLLAMLRSPLFGCITTCLLLALGMACAFWKEYIYNGNFFTMKEDGGNYWREVYIVPWCRVGCWAVGMLLGLLVFKRGDKPLRNKIFIRLGWLLATAVALFLVYIPYTEQKEGGQEWSRVERAFYEGFGRPAWGICVAWVIFACFFGKGGIVNTILSWNGFIPLSRLTYAAYLVHPVCMMVNVWSRRTLLYVDDYAIIYLFLGHLCMTYMVAFVCSLAFEAPFMALEKVLFHRGRRT